MYPNPPNPPQPPYPPYPHHVAPPPKKGLSTGAIVAIVLGSVALVVIVVAVVLGMTAGSKLVKYAKKSKQIEATINLKKLRRAAESHFQEHSRYPVAPEPVITPALGACCATGSGKCMPEYQLWDADPWRALYFAVEDPHYFSYSYQSAPDGSGFTVRAHGDLDCDGTYSTYELTSASDEVVVKNELE